MENMIMGMVENGGEMTLLFIDSQRLSAILLCVAAVCVNAAAIASVMKSEFFTLREFTQSATARQRGIANVPKEAEVERLSALTTEILDPLRRAYGKPITITSGYRSASLNKAVGGVATSQHQRGEAADFTAGTREDNRYLFNLVQEMNLPFDQLIDERNYQWIHVSYSERNRREVLHIK